MSTLCYRSLLRSIQTERAMRTSEAATMRVPTALISGVIPRRMVDQMYMGSVLSRPVRKKVTGISSNESVNDRSAEPMMAERKSGRTM